MILLCKEYKRIIKIFPMKCRLFVKEKMKSDGKFNASNTRWINVNTGCDAYATSGFVLGLVAGKGLN